jgi:hypothetical protein
LHAKRSPCVESNGERSHRCDLCEQCTWAFPHASKFSNLLTANKASLVRWLIHSVQLGSRLFVFRYSRGEATVFRCSVKSRNQVSSPIFTKWRIAIKLVSNKGRKQCFSCISHLYYVELCHEDIEYTSKGLDLEDGLHCSKPGKFRRR